MKVMDGLGYVWPGAITHRTGRASICLAFLSLSSFLGWRSCRLLIIRHISFRLLGGLLREAPLTQLLTEARLKNPFRLGVHTTGTKSVMKIVREMDQGLVTKL